MPEIAMPTMPFATSLTTSFQTPFAKSFSVPWTSLLLRKPQERQRLPNARLWPNMLPQFGHKLENLKPANPAPAKEGLSVSWAKHLSEVREAQALRYSVFVGEMGAKIKTPFLNPKLDIDRFDDYCEHLIVRDLKTEQVVGTYRLLTPVQAKRVGCFYTDTEFDLTRLRNQRDNIVELGRSCVHADFRHGGVIMSLGRELFQFMARNKFSAMFGCASIPLNMGADAAASVWAKVAKDHLVDQHEQVMPRTPFALAGLNTELDAELPAMLKGYLRLGAKVLGAPAWDPDFNTVDLPIMARMADLSLRYKKHFEIDA
jgi:putative hemolysin